MTSARDRIWTIPNMMSFARLLGVPVFLWLLLAEQADGWAFVLLVLAGISDWLDGAVARATGQVSRLGELLDPLADRLYIAATVIGLAMRGIIPWWLVIVLTARTDEECFVQANNLGAEGFLRKPVEREAGSPNDMLMILALAATATLIARATAAAVSSPPSRRITD